MSRTQVGVISLGCSKNLVDTEIMLGHLDRAGCTFVQDAADADVLVVNTCGFIDAAREESVRTILDAAKLKTTGRLKRLVVAGCMVQRYRDELTRELAGDVDAFVGLDELDAIVEAARRPRPTPASLRNDLPMFGGPDGRRAELDRKLSRYLYDASTPRKLATPPWTRLRQDRRGVRPHLLVLRDPELPGRVPLAPGGRRASPRRRRSRAAA